MTTFASIKASQLGCVLDCVLSTGLTAAGAAPTDNTTILNAYLAQASLTNPLELVMDGGTACKGIVIPQNSHVSIRGIGMESGIFILAGSNAVCLTNGEGIPFAFTGTQPTPSGSVVLRDFYINGNQGNGTNGNSNSGNPRGAPGVMFYSGVDLMNLATFSIDNVYVYAAPLYSFRITNCTYFSISNCKVYNPGGYANVDGVHINGGCNNFGINNLEINNNGWDDGIALNGPEGYTTGNTGIYNGTISNCAVTAVSLARLYACASGVTTPVRNIAISNCVSNSAWGFILGANEATSANTQDSISGITVSNCVFVGISLALVNISDPLGSLTMNNCTWKSPSTANVSWIYFTQYGAAVTASYIALSDCRIYRDTLGNAATRLAASQLALGGTIKKLALNNFSVENEAGQSYAAIADLLTMTDLSIGEISIGNMDTTLITALTASFTGITTILGPGVLGTGFQIPDANMANNTMYLSATSPNAGNPCIKLAGTVYPFTI